MTFTSDFVGGGAGVRRPGEQGQGAQIATLEEQLKALQTNVFILQNQLNGQVVPTIEEPPIDQLIRNSDACFSVDTWHNTVAAGGNQAKELALVYAHAADNQSTAYDASVNVGVTPQNCTTAANFFTAPMVGLNIVIDGAGVGGAPHKAVIDGFTSATNVHFTPAAVTTVAVVRVRVGGVKLGKLNALISGAGTTDSLKEPSHANWGSNIQSPKWDVSTGTFQFGGNTNTLTFPLGWDSAAGNFFPQIQPLQAGRSLHVQAKMALKNKYIKPKGQMYAGLYNNSDNGLEYLFASDFTITAAVAGTPAATATALYFIVAHTDLGAQFVSHIVSVAGAPTATSFNPPDVQVNLSWPFMAGIIQQDIYRKIGAGNVFLLETLDSGQSSYFDVNNGHRVDTGITTFPVVPFALSHSRCYSETTDFEGILEDGNGAWTVMRFIIPMTPTTSLAGVTELALRLGVTEPCAFECKHVTQAHGSVTVDAPSGETPFNAGMVGLVASVRDRSDQNLVLTTTVAAFTSSSKIDLTASLPWVPTVDDRGVSNLYIEIAQTDDYGYILDCVGMSLNKGQWAAHFEDKNRTLLPTSAPTGSTQGGETGGGETGGGPNCMHEDGVFRTVDGPVLGCNLIKGMMLWYGVENRYNRLKRARRVLVHDYCEIVARDTQKRTFVTNSHRFVAGLENRGHGTPTDVLGKDEKVLLIPENTYILDAIDITEIHDPEGKWFIEISFERDNTRPEECHLGICDDFVFHNIKFDPLLDPGGNT